MKIILSLFFLIVFHTMLNGQSFSPSNNFAVCPGEWITYTVNHAGGNCLYDWEVTNGVIQQTGSHQATGGDIITVMWNNSPQLGRLRARSHTCNPTSEDHKLFELSYAILSVNGLVPQNLRGESVVLANSSVQLVYEVDPLYYPYRGTSENQPKEVESYEWQIPQGWTIVSGWNTRRIVVIPDDSSGGVVRVRGKSVCNETYNSSWSSPVNITRYVEGAGAISGQDFLVCADVAPRTYSINPIPGADSYIWTIPDGWTGSSTSNTITVIPNGLNGGEITVRGRAHGINGAISSFQVDFGLYLSNNPPSITGSSVVCSSNSTFNLQNRPSNTSVHWTVSRNITIVSGQGTNNLIVRAVNTSVGGTGWLRASISGDCGGAQIEMNTWVGMPENNLLLDDLEGPSLVNVGPIVHRFGAYAGSGGGFKVVDGTTEYRWEIFPNHPDFIISANQYSVMADVMARDAVPNGSYQITVKAWNECGFRESTAFFNIVNSSGGGSGPRPGLPPIIPLSIYPNPSSDYINIEFEGDNDYIKEYELQLFNHQGNRVLNIRSNKNKEMVTTNNLPKGFYYLHIIQEDAVIRKQIVIEK